MPPKSKVKLEERIAEDEATQLGVEEVVTVTPETAPAEEKATRGRTYDNYIKTPTGEIYGPGYSVPELLAKHPTEGALASGIRGISRDGRGTHKGWTIVDAEGNPIPGLRQPKAEGEKAPRKARKGKTEEQTEGDVYDETEWAEHDAKMRAEAQGLTGDTASDATATDSDDWNLDDATDAGEGTDNWA